MLTTVAAGRVYEWSHAVGRNAAAGTGFANPSSIALAPDGVAYIISRGNENNFGSRVSKVFLGDPGEEELLGEFCYHGSEDGRQVWPHSVAVDTAGNVYVSDDWLNRIAVFDQDGNFLRHWGTPGSGPGELHGASGLAFDQNDNLFVVDAYNHRVQVFSKQGHHMASFGKHGTGPGEFHTPWGITIDSQGAVYVADWKNGRVQKLSPDGKFLAQFGQHGSSEQDLNHPSDVAVDGDGDVYVTDWGNHKVRVYDAEGNLLTTLAGDAQVLSKWAQASLNANPDMVKMRRRVKSLEPEWRFCYPSSVAYDSEHDRIIVTDTQRGRLQIYVKDKGYSAPQFNL